MDKLEKHIKDKLQTREIAPSNDAWKRISSQIETENKGRSKGSYWWAIAATFTLLAVLSFAFFNPQPQLEMNRETIVVNEDETNEVPVVLEKENPVLITAPVLTEEKSNEVVAVSENQVLEETIIESGFEVAHTEQIVNKEPLNDAQEVTDLAITDKLEEVLAIVNTMENNAIAVTDAEIDSLLFAAQRELLTNSVLDQNCRVDAMTLLNEVELEIYDDQRNPLFIKLKENFFKLRTAVADRNN